MKALDPAEAHRRMMNLASVARRLAHPGAMEFHLHLDIRRGLLADATDCCGIPLNFNNRFGKDHVALCIIA